MFKRILFGCAALCTAANAEQLQGLQEIKDAILEASTVTPQPGGMAAKLNVSSLDRILNNLADGVAQKLFAGTELPIEYHMGIPLGLAEINFKSLTVKQISGPNGNLKWKTSDSDTLMLSLSNIDMTVDIDGGAVALGGVYNVNFNSLILRNLNFNLELSTETTDEVHWVLHEISSYSIDDFVLTCDSYFVQGLIEMHHDLLLGYAEAAFTLIGEAVTAKVDHINAKVASEGKYTWISPIISPALPLNLTMTRYPEFNREGDYIRLHVDGQFLDILMQKSLSIQNEVWPTARMPQTQQFWFHESMMNSLIDNLSDTYMPFEFETPMITDQMLSLFREFRNYYGEDVKLTFGFKLEQSYTERAVQFSKTRGIIFGDVDTNSMVSTFYFYCQSESHPEKELALKLNSNMAFEFGFEVKEHFVLHASIDKSVIENTFVVEDNIGMYYHPYDSLFTYILEDLAYNFDYTHQFGIDLTPYIGLFATLDQSYRNVQLTPYVEDGFLYAGISLIKEFSPEDIIVKED